MLKNNKGFSLIELMVVVAIIGILAAIAIPNFQKFQERSHQTEAKGNLAALFTAEQAFYGEYNVYYGAFDSIGFAPIGAVGYNVGFGAPGTALPAGSGAPAGTATCFETCTNGGALATCQANYATWTCGQELNGTNVSLAAGSTVTTAQTFIAEALAKLNPNALATTYDTWTINQANTLANTTSGL